MPTKIEWSQETLNPQGWGCWGPGGTPEKPQRCWYCFVPKKLIKWPGSKCPLCQQFIPHWHPERLEIPKRWRKSRRIFWCSTSDLMHSYTPIWQIEACLKVAMETPQHTHIFCTKNPGRYADFNPWPENCWLLTTVTNQEDADQRIPELLKAQAPVLGVSLEPLLGPVDLRDFYHDGLCPAGADLRDGPLFLNNSPCECDRPGIKWLILGSMTGPGSQAHQPKPEWVQGLINQGRIAGVPIFLKDNLHWPEKNQEWPGPGKG